MQTSNPVKPAAANFGVVHARSAAAVDLALVLAVDCSSSVDPADFRMQMDGIAFALRNPALFDAIAAGQHGRIVLTLVQWSSRNSQAVAIEWRLIGTALDLDAFAREAEQAGRHWVPGGTGLASAVDFSATLLAALSIPAERRVIDVSGDGQDNEGGNPARARDRALALGLTINGLPIINGSAGLEAYYRDHVIGGPGAFVIPASDMRSFRDAMTRKLLREVSARNLS